MPGIRTLRVRALLPFALALGLAIAPAAAAHAADTCAAGASTPEAKTSQLMLDALVATNGVPGMGAAVWRDGEVVWTGCSGLRDIAAKRPVERDTVFRLASVSKLLAITAAAKLAEQGRLDLDAPVSGMLPWLRNDWSPISVRQLSAHISGMPHYQLGDRSAGERHYATGRDAVGIFAGRKLLSTPGTSYRYSSWGYTLIGAVIEARSGEHYLDYLAEEVVPGLAIQADTDGLGDNVSRLYKIGGGAPRPAPPNDFSYTWPGGGMAGTPEALVRFGGRLLQGRIVSPKTWQAMLQPTRYANGQPVRERDYGLGLGWRIGHDQDGAGIAHHAGTTDGARSALVLWPQQGLAASVLSNAQWVSVIDRTAMMLAAPHRPRPQGLVARRPCPLGATRYRGSLGERRFEGELGFRLVDGRCIGQLGAANSLGDYFDAAEAWPTRKLQLIALDSDGQLSRAALVAPTGLYDLRAKAGGGWSARFSDELTLELLL